MAFGGWIGVGELSIAGRWWGVLAGGGWTRVAVGLGLGGWALLRGFGGSAFGGRGPPAGEHVTAHPPPNAPTHASPHPQAKTKALS